MYKYKRIIYWSEENQCFLLEIPELPGCMADGKTPMEALKNGDVIISEWLEIAEEMGRK